MNFATYAEFKAAVSPHDSELVKHDWCRCPHCNKQGYSYEFDQADDFCPDFVPGLHGRICEKCLDEVDVKVVPTGQYLIDFADWLGEEEAS